MRKELVGIEETILPLVRKPSRYMGDFLNAPPRKALPGALRVLLAFPDSYEIGMSHLGTRILYHILNSSEGASAELCFAPWPDMEAVLRERRLPLFSLETRTPVREFDIVGFSLSYELDYTNVLNMLDLGQIPLRSSARGESDPLVVAGGACTANPEPVADFFDCFVIGDGEEAILELVKRFREAKSRRSCRAEFLKELSRTDGFYVPACYRKTRDSGRFITREHEEGTPPQVSSQIVPELKASYYPVKPLVTFGEISHDRLCVEVMRGCTRGCRFCLAGVAYRPVREKVPEHVIAEVETGMPSSGFDEVSLLSLSTPDYSYLDQVVPPLAQYLSSWNARLSLPSMRPETFSPELAGALCGMRRGGLTLAPEVASDRLKRFINKDVSSEEILNAVKRALTGGWPSVKLYFMIGLPGERDEDLEAMATLLKEIADLAKRERSTVHASLSLFVPKPHTAFQWERVEPRENLNKRIGYIRERLRNSRIRISWRDVDTALLEGVLARGDSRLADVIEAAFHAGSRFDGWSEFFGYGKWAGAFERCGVDPELFRLSIEEDERLPWDHIRLPVSKAFLLSERRKAYEGELSPDCRTDGCKGCGAHARAREEQGSEESAAKGTSALAGDASTYGRRAKKRRAGNMKQTLFRLRYAKGEELRFTSHLDVVRTLERAIRRSRLPIALTRGYHPHYKVSFGPPLPLGMWSEDEYMDVETAQPVSLPEVLGLNDFLPAGLMMLEGTPLVANSASLMDSISHGAYTVAFGSHLLAKLEFQEETSRLTEILRTRIAEMMQKERFHIQLQRKNGSRVVNARSSIESVQIPTEPEAVVEMLISISRGLRPESIVRALLHDYDFDERLLLVRRKALLVFCQGGYLSPLETGAGTGSALQAGFSS